MATYCNVTGRSPEPRIYPSYARDICKSRVMIDTAWRLGYFNPLSCASYWLQIAATVQYNTVGLTGVSVLLSCIACCFCHPIKQSDCLYCVQFLLPGDHGGHATTQTQCNAHQSTWHMHARTLDTILCSSNNSTSRTHDHKPPHPAARPACKRWRVRSKYGVTIASCSDHKSYNRTTAPPCREHARSSRMQKRYV